MSSSVCILTSVHQPFDGRIFYREAVSLAASGYDVTLLAPADFKQRVEKNITILGVPPATSRIGRPIVWWRLLKLVRGLQPDIVHIHDPELLLIVPAIKILVGTRVKIIYDVHEYFIDSLADKFWIPSSLRHISIIIFSSIEKILVRSLDGIICAVEGQISLYEHTGVPMAVVRNLPHASLFEGGYPHPDMGLKRFKLIYVGLILPKRGIDIVLDAMRLLHENGYTNVHLFLVGGAISETYMSRINGFCEFHSISDHVSWLGYVPHNILKDYLICADVGLLPGLPTRQYRKPALATKLFEYMLCRLPVIAADFAGNRQFVEEAQSGIVVPPEDAKAFADAVRLLANNPEKAKAMGESGRTYVLSNYTWEIEQERLLSFYAQLFPETANPQTEL
jgi:glycosyltransferase involved in cell wall biosynthesis